MTAPREDAAHGGRRRRWLFRALALLLPVAALGLLEIALRLSGSFEDEALSTPHVEFEEGEPFFPAWHEKLATPKPENTLRVFTLGGSCTLGSGVRDNFSRRLGRLLASERPDVSVEVVNGGMLAFGSHRVLEVMKEAAAYEPDLYVAYLGHNEFLEPIFFDPDGWVRRTVKTNRFARQFRTVRWIRSWFGGEIEAAKPVLARQFFGNTRFPLIRSPEQFEIRLEFLKDNLRAMAAFAEAKGIRLIVAPAVPNLLWPPGQTERGPSGLPARCHELLTRWKVQVGTGNWASACRTFDELRAETEDGSALGRYLAGIDRLAHGDDEGALLLLVRANELDRHGDRANPRIAAAILDACREQEVEAIDLRGSLHGGIGEDFQALRSGVGRMLFIDHCHPTEAGHARIAAGLLGPVLAALSERR
ncbi:MAG: hypothetical protein ACYS0K_18465 [Planctomycetota bacterium]|jgi:lysophospholipase L1-like esterase